MPWSARSDWQPVATPAEIWICDGCNHLFKDPVFVAQWADYHNYDIHGGSNAQDKINYNPAYPKHRSAALLEFLEKKAVILPDSRVLDFGCNRGSFLRFMGPGDHAGYDVSPVYRPLIESMGFTYYDNQDHLPTAAFDVLTLIHVFEHLPRPQMIQAGLKALVAEGSVLIQVPYSKTQITDWYLMDHCAHYEVGTLLKALEPSGLMATLATTGYLNGELSLLLKKKVGRTLIQPQFSSWEPVRKSLIEAESMLLELVSCNRPFRIFGAGYTGLMVAQLFKDKLSCIIDENEALHQKPLLGVPVVGINKAKAYEGEVILAVPPPATARVLGLCREAGFKAHAPFWPVEESID